LKSQKNIDTIRDLHWRDFEFLVAQAYRQQGYRVVENEEMGPDGGIDLIIEKNSNRYIVQCRQWHTVKVGVKVVREMYGTMHSVNAQGVIIITSGLFTQEAKNFAHDKSIDLVEGNELVQLIKHAQTAKPIEKPQVRPTVEKKTPEMLSDTQCPSCGSQLIVRVAKRGKNTGKEFIGCSSFPKCKFTKPIS
jgi:restriction system protein